MEIPDSFHSFVIENGKFVGAMHITPNGLLERFQTISIHINFTADLPAHPRANNPQAESRSCVLCDTRKVCRDVPSSVINIPDWQSFCDESARDY